MNTGQIVRSMRLRRGITQRKLSELLGRSPQYIAVIETREGSCRFCTIEEIAKVLGYKIIFRPIDEYEKEKN